MMMMMMMMMMMTSSVSHSFARGRRREDWSRLVSTMECDDDDDDDDNAGERAVERECEEDAREDEDEEGRRRRGERALRRALGTVETLCGEGCSESGGRGNAGTLGRGGGGGGGGRRAAAEELYAETCANAVNGTEIERQLSLLEILPTGCDSIDELLGGGLRQGQVIEFAGPSASGKTQLCLSAAAKLGVGTSSGVRGHHGWVFGDASETVSSWILHRGRG